MPSPLHAFNCLETPAEAAPQRLCVVFGDEPLLKQLVIGQWRRQVLGGDDTPFARFSGPETDWRDVRDELSTVSLFGSGPRLVVIDEADKFVTACRGELEDYAAGEAADRVLVLDVKSWPANTKLYKAVAKKGLAVHCGLPVLSSRSKTKPVDTARVARWLSQRAPSAHGVKLPQAAARLLIEIVGAHLGLLDQEIARLALHVDPGGGVTASLVQQQAGGWRTRTAFEMLDAAADGDAAEALRQLDRLVKSGEAPPAIFGPLSWSFRRYARAIRLYQRSEQAGGRLLIAEALGQAGFNRGDDERKLAEQRLRQLGRRRAGRLFQQLLKLDLALKSTHSSTPRGRLKIEQFLVSLAREVKPQSAAK